LAVFQPTRDLAAKDRAPGKPTGASGAAELAWIDTACDLASRGDADAMVTGPVSKDVIASSGAPGSRDFLGHTEHLQTRLHAREVVMAFWSKELTTALATTHLPISAVPRAITPAAVARASFWLADFLSKLASAKNETRIAVCGLNPHAGESGRLGREETTRIAPGIARARERLERAGIDATLVGPVPAESAIRLAARGEFEGVVAMYHDQATIPMKLLGFGEAVNVALALPIIRTSVDHGTAYDRAGKNTADARGMREAIALAARLVNAGGRSPS
jgi:4-hydroxythreonine-4-phosphate dehydrogenase